MLVRPLFWVRTLDFCTSTIEVLEAEGDESGGRERLRRSGYKWQAGPLQLFQEQPPTHTYTLFMRTLLHIQAEKELYNMSAAHFHRPDRNGVHSVL